MWLCYKFEDMVTIWKVEEENCVSYTNYRWRWRQSSISRRRVQLCCV